MALHTLIQQGYEIACLVTTVPEELGRTFAHGERTELIKLQAEALQIPVHFIECSFEAYTERFIESLKLVKEKYAITGVAYGDLYLDEHREWGEKVARNAGVEPLYPLWMKKDESIDALNRFVQSGYEAVVIRVREDVLNDSWLGHSVDQHFVEKIKHLDICPMGEAGEYHTFVYDGPLFTKRIELNDSKIITLETTKRLEFQKYILVDKSS